MAEKSSKKTGKKLDFEKALERLEKIVEQLENDTPPLDKALSLFQEGKKLGRLCNKELTSLEQKIQKIIEEEKGDINLEDLPAPSPDHESNDE